MKKIITILLCALAFHAFSQTPKDRQAILDVLEKQRNDWNRGDVQAYMQGYLKSDSLLFVGKDGPAYG